MAAIVVVAVVTAVVAKMLTRSLVVTIHYIDFMIMGILSQLSTKLQLRMRTVCTSLFMTHSLYLLYNKGWSAHSASAATRFGLDQHHLCK